MTSILKADTIQDTSGNNIINENANTVTIGKAGDTVNVVGTLQSNGTDVPTTAGGITEVDMWEMSTQTYNHDDWIDTGWSRFTDLSGAPHGTGLTESSGIFTFPSTGVYEILFQTYFWNPSTTRSYVGVDVRGSTDNFASNYTRLGLSYTNTSTAGDHSVFTITCIYDVTNTSNNKIRFQCQAAGSIGFYHTKLITKKLMET